MGFWNCGALKRSAVGIVKSTPCRTLLLFGVFLVGAPAWGSITFCPTSPTALNPTYTPPPSLSTGCDQANLQFTNFDVGTDAGATIDGISIGANSSFSNGSVPDGTEINLQAGPSGYGISFTPTPPNGPGFGCVPSLPNGTVQGWCIQGGNLSLASDITYTVTALNGTSFNFFVLQTTLSEHTSQAASTNASATVFREYCLGVTTVNWGNDGATACANAGGTYGVLAVGTNFFGGHSNTYTPGTDSAVFSNTTVAAIRDTVYLTTPSNGNGSWAAVGSFDFLAPEPGTFGMLGGGLAALLLWKRRRRNV